MANKKMILTLVLIAGLGVEPVLVRHVHDGSVVLVEMVERTATKLFGENTELTKAIGSIAKEIRRLPQSGVALAEINELHGKQAM